MPLGKGLVEGITQNRKVSVALGFGYHKTQVKTAFTRLLETGMSVKDAFRAAYAVNP